MALPGDNIAAFGPAPVQFLAGLLALALAVCAGVLPIDRGRPVEPLAAGVAATAALALIAWAVLGAWRGWSLGMAEEGAIVLVAPESAWVLDLALGLPLVATAPAAGLLAGMARRSPGLAVGAAIFAAISVAAVGLRELDTRVLVDPARGVIRTRTGWVLARVTEWPIAAGWQVSVVGRVRRGAPAWDVVLVDAAGTPASAATRGFRDENAAQTEAERWRRALRGG